LRLSNSGEQFFIPKWLLHPNEILALRGIGMRSQVLSHVFRYLHTQQHDRGRVATGFQQAEPGKFSLRRSRVNIENHGTHRVNALDFAY
jgi:hypothetical protein